MNENMDNNAKFSTPQGVEKKPNENAGFYFSSHLKISDPNSKEILVQKRGDN
jgi:hypothetical protein